MFVAVKPPYVSQVLKELKGSLTEKHTIVSIAAGITLATLKVLLACTELGLCSSQPASTVVTAHSSACVAKLRCTVHAWVMFVAMRSTSGTVQEAAGDQVKLIRVMPNTPCLVGETASAMCLGGKATEEDAKPVQALFSAVGKIYAVDERLLSAVTGERTHTLHAQVSLRVMEADCPSGGHREAFQTQSIAGLKLGRQQHGQATRAKLQGYDAPCRAKWEWAGVRIPHHRGPGRWGGQGRPSARHLPSPGSADRAGLCKDGPGDWQAPGRPQGHGDLASRYIWACGPFHWAALPAKSAVCDVAVMPDPEHCAASRGCELTPGQGMRPCS